jgi:hypothetical protein
VLDEFIPRPDVRERHETTIYAPHPLVMRVARELDMQSIPLVRAIFWLRGKLMGAHQNPRGQPMGIVAEMTSIGWGRLAEDPDRHFVAGAVCQPWKPDVTFSPVPAAEFAAYAEPDRVKIAWTLEAEPLGPALTRFATETRAVAKDETARGKFRGYFFLARTGIVLIRRLLLPAVRKAAEREWRRIT